MFGSERVQEVAEEVGDVLFELGEKLLLKEYE